MQRWTFLKCLWFGRRIIRSKTKQRGFISPKKKNYFPESAWTWLQWLIQQCLYNNESLRKVNSAPQTGIWHKSRNFLNTSPLSTPSPLIQDAKGGKDPVTRLESSRVQKVLFWMPNEKQNDFSIYSPAPRYAYFQNFEMRRLNHWLNDSSNTFWGLQLGKILLLYLPVSSHTQAFHKRISTDSKSKKKKNFSLKFEIKFLKKFDDKKLEMPIIFSNSRQSNHNERPKSISAFWSNTERSWKIDWSCQLASKTNHFFVEA